MEIKKNVPLAPYTTFQIGGPARLFCTVKSEAELVEAVEFSKKEAVQTFILGKGSNLLVSDAGFPGLVIKMEIMGVEYADAPDHTIVKAGAGETWDHLVDDCVERGLYGIENLSAIPGTVGAAPVQNIGAYGVEVSKTLVSVRALDTESMEFVELANADCRFDYRDSIFKQEKGRYIIVSVTLKLEKNGKVDIGYKDVRDFFVEKGRIDGAMSAAMPSAMSADAEKITAKDVRDAVVAIRLKKLPDWKHWGTAGSFFKNPVVSAEEFAKLVEKYPGLPGFKTNDGRVKVSLGWILDKVCKVKELPGCEQSNVHPYEKQALVLVATPGATAAEVVALAHKLMDAVKEKTGLNIDGEVQWVC